MLISTFGKKPNYDHKKDIEIELFAWAENNELYYIYTPGANVNFVTNQPTQTLTIALKSNQSGRFKIHSYSIRDKSMCPEVFYEHQGSFVVQPIADGHLFTTLPINVRFKLNLTETGTYITLNVIDVTTKCIISCDPQVENGTKTGP